MNACEKIGRRAWRQRPCLTPQKSYQKGPGAILQSCFRKEMAGTIASAYIFIGLARCQETNGCVHAPDEACGTGGRNEIWSSADTRMASWFTQTANRSAGANTDPEKNFLASTTAATIADSHRDRAQLISGGSPASLSTGSIAGVA
jgi:hypothetical protein